MVDEIKTYMVLPSPQIAIGLLLISIGIVVTFDIKIDSFKNKKWKKFGAKQSNDINLIIKELSCLDQE